MANETITVIEADGTTQTDIVVLGVGRQAEAASKSITLATEDKAVLDAAAASLAALDNAIAGSEMQVDVLTVGGQSPAYGAGAVGVAVPRVTLASDDPAVTSLQIIDNAIAGNEMQVDVLTIAAGDNNIGNVDIASIAPGTNAIGKLAANSGVDIGDVDILTINGVAPAFGSGNVGATVLRVAMANDTVNANGSATSANSSPVVIASDQAAVAVNPTPATTGGLTIFRSIDLDETEEEIKATAGQVYGMWVTNTATSTRFVKFYNGTAAGVTVGATTPVITIGIPGNTSDDVSGLFSSAHGIAFGTAITAAATTGVADADTGAPGPNEVIVNVFYK